MIENLDEKCTLLIRRIHCAAGAAAKRTQTTNKPKKAPEQKSLIRRTTKKLDKKAWKGEQKKPEKANKQKTCQKKPKRRPQKPNI